MLCQCSHWQAPLWHCLPQCLTLWTGLSSLVGSLLWIGPGSCWNWLGGPMISFGFAGSGKGSLFPSRNAAFTGWFPHPFACPFCLFVWGFCFCNEMGLFCYAFVFGERPCFGPKSSVLMDGSDSRGTGRNEGLRIGSVCLCCSTNWTMTWSSFHMHPLIV